MESFFFSGERRLITKTGVSHSKRQKQPPGVFYKKAVFKSFAIFTVKHLRQSLLLIKLQRDSNAAVFKGDTKLKTQIIFVFPQKQAKTQPAFWSTVFYDKFTLWHIKITIYIQFTSQKLICLKYSFGLIFSQNPNRTQQTKHNTSFFTLSEMKRLTNLRKQQLQKTFSLVCMLLIQVAWMFLIPYDRHVSCKRTL